MVKWPIILRPKKDELLSSWLIRSSIALGDEPSGLSSTIWSDWRPWTIDLDRSVDSARLSVLVELTGISLAELESMTLRSTIERISNKKTLNPKKSWDWVIPTGNRNRTRINGLHFCPLCLKEAPVYFRKSWRLAWNVGCERHQIRLLSNCPNCNTVVSPHLATYKSCELGKCKSCDFDLTRSSSNLLHSDAMWLQCLMNESLGGKVTAAFLVDLDEIELFEIVHFLMMFFLNSVRALKPFKRLHQALGITSSKLRDRPSIGVRIEGRTVVERESLMVAVARLLKMHLDDATQLLVGCGVTQQMFMVRQTKSKVIHRIKNSLTSNPKVILESKRRDMGYKPRTKEAVDKLMSEIERFL